MSKASELLSNENMAMRMNMKPKKKTEKGDSENMAMRMNMKPKKKSNEAFDVDAALKSLIDTKFSSSEEEKGKAVELLKGLFFSDEEKAKEVVKKLDDWFSSMGSDE